MITVNGHEIKPTMFPDFTSQVWNLPDEIMKAKKLKVVWKFKSEDELIHLAQLKDLLDKSHKDIMLDIPYLPYSRQDKEVSNTSTFALRTFAKILNSLDFLVVTTLDPHSREAAFLIKNLVPVYPSSRIERIFYQEKADLICYPDKGALDKYARMLFLCGLKHIYFTKERDAVTGSIKNLTLYGDPKDKNVLIVDDICDGGATFIGITRMLKEHGAKEVNLFVSHGIFSRGTKVLKEAGINNVFAACVRGDENDTRHSL